MQWLVAQCNKQITSLSCSETDMVDGGSDCWRDHDQTKDDRDLSIDHGDGDCVPVTVTIHESLMVDLA